jgi:hypothetical protein
MVGGAMLDGVEQLTALLVGKAGYPSVVAAVAEHAVFLHPETVAQTNGEALFATIRLRNMSERGDIAVVDGHRVLLDDNTSPTDAFLWAAGIGRSGYRDTQFNHVWNAARDASAYTALWNLCATPAFLAKTTDGSNHPEVTAALRYHAYHLHGFLPHGVTPPQEPPRYQELRWAAHPEPVTDLAAAVRARLRRTPKSRTAKACREIGWLFSRWLPDPGV